MPSQRLSVRLASTRIRGAIRPANSLDGSLGGASQESSRALLGYRKASSYMKRGPARGGPFFDSFWVALRILECQTELEPARLSSDSWNLPEFKVRLQSRRLLLMPGSSNSWAPRSTEQVPAGATNSGYPGNIGAYIS